MGRGATVRGSLNRCGIGRFEIHSRDSGWWRCVWWTLTLIVCPSWAIRAARRLARWWREGLSGSTLHGDRFTACTTLPRWGTDLAIPAWSPRPWFFSWQAAFRFFCPFRPRFRCTSLGARVLLRLERSGGR